MIRILVFLIVIRSFACEHPAFTSALTPFEVINNTISSQYPTSQPTIDAAKSNQPSVLPSNIKTDVPSLFPSSKSHPTLFPSSIESILLSVPSNKPSPSPNYAPTSQPNQVVLQTFRPSSSPSNQELFSPSVKPSSKGKPTYSPSSIKLIPSSNPSNKLLVYSPTYAPTTLKKIKERVFAKVFVYMASVPTIMDSKAQNQLESVFTAWFEKLFILNDPPIKEISTIITSQHLETGSSTSHRMLRTLQNVSGYKIKLSIDITGWFTPTLTVLSSADMAFQDRIVNVLQDHRLTDILLGMIQENSMSDPSNPYFANVFMVQTAFSPTTKTSSSLVGVMKIVVGSVSGAVGAVAIIVLILIWRQRRKRYRRTPENKSPTRFIAAFDGSTKPNSPDRDVASVSDTDVTPIHISRTIKNGYENMEDSESIVDFSVFSVPDMSVIRSSHPSQITKQLEKDVDMGLNSSTSFDSISLPTYSEFGFGTEDKIQGLGLLITSKSLSLGDTKVYNGDYVADQRLSFDENDSYINPINPISCIQEMSELNMCDESDSLPEIRLHHISSRSDKVDLLYVRSDDSVSMNTYDNYSIAAMSCIASLVPEVNRVKGKDTVESDEIFKPGNLSFFNTDDSSVESISVSSLSLKSKDYGAVYASIFKSDSTNSHDSLRSFPSLNMVYSYASTGSNPDGAKIVIHGKESFEQYLHDLGMDTPSAVASQNK